MDSGAERFLGRAHLPHRRRCTFATPAAMYAFFKLLRNPWAEAREETERTAEFLAERIRTKFWGDRRISLIGFSLGARIIFKLLQKLDDEELSDLIEDVVLLGGAVGAKSPGWDRFGANIAGHMVNGYCVTDRILKNFYQFAEWEKPIGVAPIGSPHIVDCNVGDLAPGHLHYEDNLPTIIPLVHNLLENGNRIGGRQDES